MNEVSPKEFFKALAFIGLVWLGGGTLYFWGESENLMNFVQLFVLTALDLVFLILIVVYLLESRQANTQNRLKILSYVTFKLVCLGFLAIKLKRLQSVPVGVLMLGIGFIGVGPGIAALFARNKRE